MLTAEDLEMLARLNYNTDFDEFVRGMGLEGQAYDYQMEKFDTFKRNALYYFTELDNTNRRRFVRWADKEADRRRTEDLAYGGRDNGHTGETSDAGAAHSGREA